MNKKELAITFGVTGNWSFALANVLLSIKKHSSKLKADFIVYHDNLAEKDKAVLNSILPCKFVNYNFPYDVSGLQNPNIETFSMLAFSRYECFDLLKEYKRVLWLDVDILIQKDISGLLNYTESGFGILAPEGSGEYMGHNYGLGMQFYTPIEDFNMDTGAYATGTFILGDNLRNYENMTNWCYEKTFEYFENLKYPDLAIINCLIQEFNIEPSRIDYNKYCCYPLNPDYKKAVILHPPGQEKFWNFYDFKEWNKNYKFWLKLGGTPYKGRKASWFFKKARKIFPGCPDPLRQTRGFIKFLLKK